uniref:EF-hand domain-containing protein n=1 Tax=Nelumbo nucifera TaxID=4432 RepID=A0A822XMI9_NELNU|nr:TPA_asm: hypothetical protein HUJ06_023043 [Nelumbo nucifera]
MAIQNRSVTRSREIASNGKREMTVEDFRLWLKKFDVNGDGRISRKELQHAIRSVGGWFASWKNASGGINSADVNGDGYIDDTEINYLLDFAEKHMGVKIIPY